MYTWRVTVAGALVGLATGFAIGLLLFTIWFGGQPADPGTVCPRVIAYTALSSVMTAIAGAVTAFLSSRRPKGENPESPRWYAAPQGCWMGFAVGFAGTLFVCALLRMNGQSVLLAMVIAPLIGITNHVAARVLDQLQKRKVGPFRGPDG